MAMEDSLLLDQDIALDTLNAFAAASRLSTLTLQLMQTITACKELHLATHQRLLVAFLSAFSEEPSPARGASPTPSSEQVFMQSDNAAF